MVSEVRRAEDSKYNKSPSQASNLIMLSQREIYDCQAHTCIAYSVCPACHVYDGGLFSEIKVNEFLDTYTDKKRTCLVMAT